MVASQRLRILFSMQVAKPLAMPPMPIVNLSASLPHCPTGPGAANRFSDRPSRSLAPTLALAVALLPCLALAEGLWDRVKEGAVATYDRGADLVYEGAEKGGDLVPKGAEGAGSMT